MNTYFKGKDKFSLFSSRQAWFKPAPEGKEAEPVVHEDKETTDSVDKLQKEKDNSSQTYREMMSKVAVKLEDGKTAFTADSLRTLVNTGNPELIIKVAARKEIPVDLLVWIAKYGPMESRVIVAGNPSLPSGELEKLAVLKDEKIWEDMRYAEKSRLESSIKESEWLVEHAGNNDIYIKDIKKSIEREKEDLYAITNASKIGEFWDNKIPLLSKFNESVRRTAEKLRVNVVSNPNTPEQSLHDIHDSYGSKNISAANRLTSPAWLGQEVKKLTANALENSRTEDYDELFALAKNPSTPPDALVQLSLFKELKNTVLENPSMPTSREQLEMMKKNLEENR